MSPRTLDHVALWVSERDQIADACVELGMHVIDRTDAFTIVGFDARRGKLTLFAADPPRERGALARIGVRVPGGGGDELELPDGLVLRLADGDPDVDHVSLFSADPEGTARRYLDYGFEAAGAQTVAVGDARVEFLPGEPGDPERPLLNHLGLLVDSAEEHRAEAAASGFEVADFVDAPNTIAAFVWGPERVKLEYVEHKPTFALR